MKHIEEYKKKQKYLDEKYKSTSDSSWWDSMIYEDEPERIRSYDNDD